MRKGIKATLITVGSIVGVIGLGLGTTATVEAVASGEESKKIQSYGSRVAISNGSVNVVDKGQGEKTIVLLPGYGTASPVLDFDPLITELSKTSRVVAYEPLGYGLSDGTTSPRTTENYVRELHETLQKLEVKKPVLMGHSISGIYALQYVKDYPNEVAGFIGIDHSVPGQPKSDQVPPVRELRQLKDLGIMRVVKALSGDPYADGPYSAEAREQMSLLSNKNSMSDTTVNEALELPNNFGNAKGQTWPSDLPILFFVAKDGELDGWTQIHQDQAKQSTRSKVLVLDGTHYLHHTQSPEIVKQTQDFLKNTVSK